MFNAPAVSAFFDLDRHTLRRIFYAPATAVKPVVVARPEVEPEGATLFI